jgi:sugar/nucleoside kinase (ribokinase family)
VLNDQEAFLLSDERDLVRAGRKICDFGLRYVVVKKGEHGALIFHDREVIALPALPITDLVDPTGAGDSFAGGLVGYLASVGRTDLGHFKRAVAWGTVVASFCCEGFGVSRSLEITRESVEDRFDAYRTMLTVDA